VLSCEPDKVSKSQIDSRLEERDVEVEVLRQQLNRDSKRLQALEEVVELLRKPGVSETLEKKEES